jgi:CRP-like cAMP-binding protein
MDTERLKKLPLFEELSHKELERIATWTDEVDLPAGKHIIEEGTFAHEFFVIEEGTADVFHDGRLLGRLGPGDFFGEVALIEGHRRMASVLTTSPMRAVVMFQREFEAMDREMPEVAERIRDVMRARRSDLEDEA